jgi:hypothetical protein
MDLSFLTGNMGLLAGGGTAGLILWVLKKVPNETIYSSVEKLFKGMGMTVTLGLGKWKLTKKYWNNTIEPWLIDLVDNTVGAAVNGFIKGLRSDK